MPSTGRFRYLEAPRQSSARDRGALLLIHAFPVNARMWERQLAFAERGWRVIAPHLRGFGRDAADPPATSVDDYAADLIDLLDALHIADAVVCGLSMGGYVAFAMFRHAPRYIRALIVADTRSQADTPEGVAGRQRLLQVIADKGPAGVADQMIPTLLGETTKKKRPDVIDEVRALVLENSAEAIAGGTRALMTRPDSTPLLGSIHCSTLIVVGDEDTVTPKARAEELQSGIRGSELAVIAGAGHLSNLEQPEAFNQTLARFLDHRV
jgi:pimeloyl-ACP methyl ester carboxylesterase